ncbi:hypothetical protein ACFSCW_02620 [Sphingomonas tabacisoli]|jgi:hypothetical protein|uniref:Uncharacterized protein n=1 Tax=Sphingomonas tabacisoli TaxID=2249466 RepID=A0ABW4HZB0_9SPHN
MGSVWIIFLALATIALGLVMFTGMIRNRKHNSPSEIARTEQATREFRERGADNAPEDRVER